MLQQQWKILLHHFYRCMFLNLILMLDSLPGVWWSSSSRNGVCRPSSACQPSAACKRSTMSTSLCKCSKAKGSTSRMNAVIVIFYFFFLSERTIKRGDAQPVKVFALHRMKFYFLCVLCNVFFHRSVTHSLCFHTGLYFPPLCHFTWAWTPVFSPHTFCAGSPTAAKQHNCLLCPSWRHVGCVWTLCVNMIVCPCAVNMCQSD